MFVLHFVQRQLEEHGVPFREHLVKHNYIGIDETCLQMERIIKGQESVGPGDFTAIATLSDVIAIGIYEAALSLHFSIPETYSVVGYDNILATKYLNPPLTTINQPKQQTGLYAANILLDCIEQRASEKVQIILNPELLVRSSVAHCRTVHDESVTIQNL